VTVDPLVVRGQQVIEPVGPCWICNRPAYATDDDGLPAHPCCTENGPDCPACIASDKAEAKWQAHGRQWAERVKAYWNEQTREEPDG